MKKLMDCFLIICIDNYGYFFTYLTFFIYLFTLFISLPEDRPWIQIPCQGRSQDVVIALMGETRKGKVESRRFHCLEQYQEQYCHVPEIEISVPQTQSIYMNSLSGALRSDVGTSGSASIGSGSLALCNLQLHTFQDSAFFFCLAL